MLALGDSARNMVVNFTSLQSVQPQHVHHTCCSVVLRPSNPGERALPSLQPRGFRRAIRPGRRTRRTRQHHLVTHLSRRAYSNQVRFQQSNESCDKGELRPAELHSLDTACVEPETRLQRSRRRGRRMLLSAEGEGQGPSPEEASEECAICPCGSHQHRGEHE